MRIDATGDQCNPFTVIFPIAPRIRYGDKGELACDYQSRFSDACYALELDGWKEWRFHAPPVGLPVQLMYPEWGKPRIAVATATHTFNYDEIKFRKTVVGLYWKHTGISKELA